VRTPRLLVQTEHYTEGVVLARDGTLYFSITATGEIMSMHVAERSARVWGHVPAANGHKIDGDGTHIVMASTGSIIRLDETGRAIKIVATTIDKRKLVYPNDVTLDPWRGGYYITDSGYQSMPAAIPADGSGEGRVFRIDRDGTAAEVASGIAYANGIALSPAGSLCYVGESMTGTIWTYDVHADGTLGPRTFFARAPDTDSSCVPDGISVAFDGSIFVAHYGAGEVLHYSPDGALVERIPAGNEATSHVAVSPDARTLYISGGIKSESGAGAIYVVDL
jgi:gluconolactonase